MNYNNDFKYDLKVGQTKEIELGNIFTNKTIEVKYDLQGLNTDNIFIEYESRGKKSGISTSLSDYYCFCLGETFQKKVVNRRNLKILFLNSRKSTK